MAAANDKPVEPTSAGLRSSDLIARMSANHPSLGILCMLPRELRDIVYKDTLICDDNPFWLQKTDVIEFGLCRMKWCGVDFGILQTSKTLRQEALAALYTHGIFEFPFTDWLDGYRRDDLLWVDHISNVDLTVDGENEWNNVFDILNPDPQDGYSALTSKPAVPLSFFTGTQILRNTCRITFCHCTPESLLLLRSPFFPAVSELTGFKTVQLVFKKQHLFDKVQQDPTDGDACHEFRELAVKFTAELEATLGSGVIDDLSEDGKTHKVTFHPRS